MAERQKEIESLDVNSQLVEVMQALGHVHTMILAEDQGNNATGLKIESFLNLCQGMVSSDPIYSLTTDAPAYGTTDDPSGYNTSVTPANNTPADPGNNDPFPWLNVTRYEQCEPAYRELQDQINQTILQQYGHIYLEPALIKIENHYVRFSESQKYAKCIDQYRQVQQIFYYFKTLTFLLTKIVSEDFENGMQALQVIVSQYNQHLDVQAMTQAAVDLECLSEYVRQEGDRRRSRYCRLRTTFILYCC